MVTRWSDVVSLFHQNEGGIGKSILMAERFPLGGDFTPRTLGNLAVRGGCIFLYIPSLLWNPHYGYNTLQCCFILLRFLRDLDTVLLPPGDQGVRLQSSRHFSRVSTINMFSNWMWLWLWQWICQLDLIYMFVCTRGVVHCREPIEVLSYKIGVCKVARYGDHDDHDNGDDDDGNGDNERQWMCSSRRLVSLS